MSRTIIVTVRQGCARWDAEVKIADNYLVVNATREAVQLREYAANALGLGADDEIDEVSILGDLGLPGGPPREY